MKNITIACLIMMSIFFCACITTEYKKDESADPFLGKEVWTCTNLHLFEKQYIYVQNYLSGEIFPIGTAVRLKEVNENHAIFIDNYNKSYIIYYKNKEDKTTFAEVFSRYFSEKNPQKLFARYSQEIKDSISIGEVKRGMTKEQVLISLGWSPSVKNSEKEDIWIYNESEWNKRAIYFENNKVTQIVYSE